MLELLRLLFIEPIQSLYNLMFGMLIVQHHGSRATSVGLIIIQMSFIINLIMNVVFNANDKSKEDRWTSHIKNNFKGKEKYMMTSAYYKATGTSMLTELSGFIPLILQICSFIAAYEILNKSNVLGGQSFYFIKDLMQPDELLSIGTIKINVLPILMTVVNIVASILYCKGKNKKELIQPMILAVAFLIILYNAPSGMVLYWLSNNVFYLIHILLSIDNDIVKEAKKAVLFILIIYLLEEIQGGARTAGRQGSNEIQYLKQFIYPFVIYHVINILAIIKTKRKIIYIKPKKTNAKDMVIACLLMWAIIGLIIPSSLIANSIGEFQQVETIIGASLASQIIRSAIVMFGLCFIYPLGIYISNKKINRWIPYYAIIALLILGVINLFKFSSLYGYITKELVFENSLVWDWDAMVSSVGMIIVLIPIMVMFFEGTIKKYTNKILLCTLTGVLIISSVNLFKIGTNKNNGVVAENKEIATEWELSKKDKNVVVFMLDRLSSDYVKCIFNESEEMKNAFSDFTFYDNTISHGSVTILGTPGIYGGYEYTPLNINKRENETLKDKHNEALKIMPLLFSDEGYDITVCDQPYGNYEFNGDMSIYDKYDNIKGLQLEGHIHKNQQIDDDWYKKLYGYSIMKFSAPYMQGVIYNYGNYMIDRPLISLQTLETYPVLQNLEKMTGISDKDNGSFLIVNNQLTHSPTELQLPNYELSEDLNNYGYNREYRDDGYGNRIYFKDFERGFNHYCVDFLALKEVAEWMQYLKDNNIYDNTKIIIVSDHGIVPMTSDKVKSAQEVFHATLLVKDFNQHGFEVDSTFMTNAETPSIAFEGIIENPVNPFTGNKILSEKEQEQYLLISDLWNPSEQNGNKFVYNTGGWYKIKDSIFEETNIEKLDYDPSEEVR